MIRIPSVRKAISCDKSVWFSWSLTLGAVGAATAVRWALTSVGATLTFATYFPAVLICGLLSGWRYGAACTVISGIVGEVLFPHGADAMSATALANLIVFWAAAAVIVATADSLRRAVRELAEANRLARLLNEELQHRVGNMLTVVQAIASQSIRGVSTTEFIAAFSGRLQALREANRLVGERSLETCALPDLVDVACEPFCKGANIVKNGPPCLLPAESCVPLVLALHELCTNAVKYGALSVPGGRVYITWEFCAKPDRLAVRWEEVGGPPVQKPSRKGFGTRLLKTQPGIADLELAYEQSGVRCAIYVDGAEPLEKSTRATFSSPLLRDAAAA